MSNQYDIRTWLRYLEVKRLQCLQQSETSNKSNPSKPDALDWLYERSVSVLPGSFKLWNAYLQHRIDACHAAPANQFQIQLTLNVFRRACLCLPRMPRIWIEYMRFVQAWTHQLTLLQEVLNAALAALPVTQHVRIWDCFFEGLPFREVQLLVPEFIKSCYRRMIQLLPERRDAFIRYLRRIGDWDGVAQELFNSLSELNLEVGAVKYEDEDDAGAEKEDELNEMEDTTAADKHEQKFTSSAQPDATKRWIQLCNVLLEHGNQVQSLDVPGLFRTALRLNRSHQGRFWTGLATFHLKQGRIAVARETFETAMQSVWLVRDFAQIFDAYAKMEETLVSIQLERLTLQKTAANKKKKKKQGRQSSSSSNVTLLLADYEALLQRHPLLLNAVLLRQNPHNVSEWIRKSQLLPERRVAVLEEAIRTVNPGKAGSTNQLWIALAEAVSEEEEAAAERVFEKAAEGEEADRFASPDDFATLLIAYAEFLRDNRGRLDYLDPVYAALEKPFTKKCLKLWNFLLDEEEARGTEAACQAVYDRLLQVKLAQPQHIINYALFCEMTLKDMEAAFRVYERGIELFGFPVAFEIWNVYLPKAVKFLGAAGRLERVRDLFESALQGCPAQFVRDLGLLYAAFEQEYGLGRNALAVLRRTCLAAANEHRPALFSMLAESTAKQEGLLACRPVYEEAIKSVDPVASVDFSLKYAQLEEELGEVARARVLYLHAAPLCDPRTFVPFWDAWKEFEVRCGDEATFREMLRVKRSVLATFTERLPYVKATTTAPAASVDDVEATNAIAAAGVPVVAAAFESTVVNEEEIQLDL